MFISPAAIPVHENARRGQQIVKISATDADAPGPNSTVTYSYISGDTGMFLLDRRTGELTLNIDFTGVRQTFDLVVEAADGCDSSSSSSSSSSGYHECRLRETFKFTVFPEGRSLREALVMTIRSS